MQSCIHLIILSIIFLIPSAISLISPFKSFIVYHSSRHSLAMDLSSVDIGALTLNEEDDGFQIVNSKSKKTKKEKLPTPISNPKSTIPLPKDYREHNRQTELFLRNNVNFHDRIVLVLCGIPGCGKVIVVF